MNKEFEQKIKDPVRAIRPKSPARLPLMKRYKRDKAKLEHKITELLNDFADDYTVTFSKAEVKAPYGFCVGFTIETEMDKDYKKGH
jgi:hypothetical protein